MTTFDKNSWRFPVEQLRVDSAVLCLRRDTPQSAIYSDGGRITFLPIDLPDIDYGYNRSASVALEVIFAFPRIDFDSVSQLAGREFRPDDDWRSEHCGSLYAFSAHNPVDTLYAEFGTPTGDTIPLDLVIRLDFDFERRIGGTVMLPLSLQLTTERRWREA